MGFCSRGLGCSRSLVSFQSRRHSLADELKESDTFAQVEPGTTANLFAQLAGRIDTSIHPRDLSAGQQLALVLAIQLAKQAKVLILDEPTRGLDYAAKRALAKQLLAVERGKFALNLYQRLRQKSHWLFRYRRKQLHRC